MVNLDSVSNHCIDGNQFDLWTQHSECILVSVLWNLVVFYQGFHHISCTTLNLNALRLGFEVYLKEPNKKVTIVPSVVSDIIKDKRTHEALKIVDFSESTAPTKGGKKIVIFTGKICKDDIEVHFSFENSEYNPNQWVPSLLPMYRTR